MRQKCGALFLLLCGAVFLLSGCAATVVSSFQKQLAETLEQETDLALLREGLPSMYLLWKSMAPASESAPYLLDGIRLTMALAALLDENDEPLRARRMFFEAKEMAQRLLSLQPLFQQGALDDLSMFFAAVDKTMSADVPFLFWVAQAWGGWIQSAGDDPAALIFLPKTVRLMERVVLLDETYYHGGAHLFLGIYHSSRPAFLGGDMAKGQKHFEKALVLSHRQFLPVQVYYAATYARMALDRDLFVSLLSEVNRFQPDGASRFGAANSLAKKQAQKLLEHTDDYF